MANKITSKRVPGTPPLSMSNLHTAVVFDVLGLAGCALAKSEWEQRVVYFLVQHDQSRIGLGMAGFDIAALGWTASAFDAEKRFLLASSMRRWAGRLRPASPRSSGSSERSDATGHDRAFRLRPSPQTRSTTGNRTRCRPRARAKFTRSTSTTSGASSATTSPTTPRPSEGLTHKRADRHLAALSARHQPEEVIAGPAS